MSMPVLRYKMPLITKMITAFIMMMPSTGTIRQELTPMEILRYIFLSAGGRLNYLQKHLKIQNMYWQKTGKQAGWHITHVPRPLNCEHVYMHCYSETVVFCLINWWNPWAGTNRTCIFRKSMNWLRRSAPRSYQLSTNNWNKVLWCFVIPCYQTAISSLWVHQQPSKLCTQTLYVC